MTDMDNLKQKAEGSFALHHGPTVLILANARDVASAKEHREPSIRGR